MSGSVVVGSVVFGGLVIGVELLMWWLLSRHGLGHKHGQEVHGHPHEASHMGPRPPRPPES